MIMTAHRMQPTASTELMTMTDAEHGAHGNALCCVLNKFDI